MGTPPVIPPPIPTGGLSAEDLRYLASAKAILENPGLTARLSNLLGSPIEKGFKMLPRGWSETINKVSRTALLKALQVAVVTMGRSAKPAKSSNRLHKLLVGASGGIGGAFGLAALAVELPISTTIMLRSVAEIARSEGHDPRSVETKLACLEVFALGGRTPGDDATESGYWAVRAALAKAVSEAASYLAEKGVLEKTAPAVVRLITSIASRFGVIVSEQVAAKAIPIVGAAGGSIINVLFMNHFQDMARGHFIVKRLERKYGTACVQAAYNQLAVPVV